MLTVNLSPELELQVRQAAAHEGITPESYTALALEDRLRRQSAPLSAETHLLAEINRGLPSEAWHFTRWEGD